MIRQKQTNDLSAEYQINQEEWWMILLDTRVASNWGVRRFEIFWRQKVDVKEVQYWQPTKN
jgi:hypothetical protein